ncbi:uncharacterized protein LOC130199709 [Pseudoliparis swirei]|uniref:uncharacterized protein LOC130199709 n=1 Tax=Pseudoliparis swirei TaxID=2059687 RepID=UPI0024BD85AF|nr:uncharacterized protein LOC130199709 [Pseudoliparis swirei]
MERTMCFPLLLLICSLSAAQLQTQTDNEIHGKQTESQGREATKTSNQQQICPPDIHAVLRDMSVLLAEQTVEIRHLWRENEVLAAKLREQEVQKPEVDKLKQQLKDQSSLISAQAAELINMNARTNITESQVEALKRTDEVKRVAFSASLLASGSGTIGPFNTFVPLVFKYIVTNIGNAYCPTTGLFTAPVRGAYHFEFYLTGNGGASHGSGALLVRNGEQIFVAYESQTGHNPSSANGATLLLEVGDVVFLRLWANTNIFDNEPHQSTFSGFLLFPM